MIPRHVWIRWISVLPEMTAPDLPPPPAPSPRQRNPWKAFGVVVIVAVVVGGAVVAGYFIGTSNDDGAATQTPERALSTQSGELDPSPTGDLDLSEESRIEQGAQRCDDGTVPELFGDGCWPYYEDMYDMADVTAVRDRWNQTSATDRIEVCSGWSQQGDATLVRNLVASDAVPSREEGWALMDLLWREC